MLIDSRQRHRLEGPPGTAKPSFTRIVAEILFGLGKV
jgi:hypothetical protein